MCVCVYVCVCVCVCVCDPSVLDCPQTDREGDHPILGKEEEAAVQSLKKGKSAGVDNIQAELVQADGGSNHRSHDNLQ